MTAARFTPGGATPAVAVDVEVASMRARVDEVRARLATVTIVDDVAVARLEAAGWTCLPPGTAAGPPAEPEAPKISP